MESEFLSGCAPGFAVAAEQTELSDQSWTLGGKSGLSGVKSSSTGRSKLGDAVIGQTIEPLVHNVGVSEVSTE